MSTTTILNIQKNIGRYGLSTLLIFGNIGNILTIIIMTKGVKKQPNSCSLYLLSACISNWIVINTGLISNIVGIDHLDPQNTSNAVCKLRWAGVHALLMLSRSFMIAACIDRWALCSQNTTIRSLSRPRIAVRIIIILLIVWTVIPIHIVVYYSNNTGRCIALPGTYAFFYALYSLVVIGILPLFLMILFGLLAWRNLQIIRSRVTPVGDIAHTAQQVQIHKRDRDLMKMLSGEVLVYCITTIPYPINLIYSVSTSSIAALKSPIRLAIESLIGYIVSPLLNFMYCCAQFYASTVFIIQQNIGRYGLSTLLIFGNIGNILTIIIMTKGVKKQPNSCSLYLLSACISNWIVINTGLISNIVGIDHLDPQNTSNAVCKLRWAGVHALLMLSRSFMIAACIDRWALCSQNTTIRSLSRPRIAVRIIILLLIVWTVIPIHIVVYYSNNTGRCIALPGTYALFYALYSLVVIGILPLFLMILFGLLAWRNLQIIRSRVTPAGDIAHTAQQVQIHKRDRDLMKMLSGEVLVYCITTIPYPINLIYSVSTSSIAAYKSPIRLSIESLIGYIVSPLLNFMYCCAQFYVYAFSSARFRRDFMSLFYSRIENRNDSKHIIGPTTHHLTRH
ncbi:unnamed protein product [Adineta steineri]|uniref:G-protein coupled receptors family 1 profile domain-containing protein n=1 Tax=Adineta steineri TaxID=433720 RepID=A0A814DIP5_9BILA|nr:unnamed protein product [Adineta steineri]